MFGLGIPELVLILCLALLLFGKHLPTVCRSIGSAFGGFRKEARSIEEDVQPIR